MSRHDATIPRSVNAKGQHMYHAHPDSFGILATPTLSHAWHPASPHTGKHRWWPSKPAGYWAGYGGYTWPWAGPTYSTGCTTHTVRGRVRAINNYSRFPDVNMVRFDFTDELFWYAGDLSYVRLGSYVQCTYQDCGAGTQLWLQSVLLL